MVDLWFVFAHVCGQGRCFVADGAALPVCQRCFGLYAGAAVTGVWLVASGLWRRGLPDRRVAMGNIAVLLLAMASGLHAVESGAAWRVICGLWTGHVVVRWLVGGAVHLLEPAASRGSEGVSSRKSDTVQGLAAMPVLAAAGWAFCLLSPTGWRVWAGLTVLGAGVLLTAVGAGVGTAGGWVVCAVRGAFRPKTVLPSRGK